MGAPLVALAVIAPWLVWLPFVTAPATTIVLGSVAIVGSCHGWGRLVARLAGREEVDAPLAMQWGVAALLAVGGVMLAFGAYDARLLLLAGTAAHSADLAMRITAVREALTPALALRRARFWIIPLGLLVLVALVNVLGAAGQITARSFDDECNVIAQVERLSTTGALADPIGYPRDTQLGGHITLSALATAFGDARLGRIFDRGIGLVLVLLLVCARTRPRDTESAIWTTLLIVLAATYAPASPDPLPLWSVVGLILASHATIATTSSSVRSLLPIGLLAGALWVIRSELAPIACAFVLAAWWADRKPWSRDWPRIAILIGGVAMIAGAYALARHAAWATVDDSASAMLAARKWPLVVRLGVFSAIAGVLAPLFAIASRELEDRSLRWLGLACAVGVAGIASRLVAAPPLASQISSLLWSVGIAGFIGLAIALANRRTVLRVVMVLATLSYILVHESQSPPAGEKTWSWRYWELLLDVEHARDRARMVRVYDDVLAHVPAGDRVAAWVALPEVLDYRRVEIVDLRTAKVARSRHAKHLEKLVTVTKARWLLVETRDQARFAGLIDSGRSVASTAEVRLVELR